MPIKGGPLTALVEQEPGHSWHLTTDGITPYYIYQCSKNAFTGPASREQAPDQRPEANNGESTPTSDSSEAGYAIAHSNNSRSDSSKPQQSHLRNARGEGRGNAPRHQAPQKVTLAGKGIIDATVHPPPPPPLRPCLAHPALLVATTHTEKSTSATTAGAGNTLR